MVLSSQTCPQVIHLKQLSHEASVSALPPSYRHTSSADTASHPLTVKPSHPDLSPLVCVTDAVALGDQVADEPRNHAALKAAVDLLLLMAGWLPAAEMEIVAPRLRCTELFVDFYR